MYNVDEAYADENDLVIKRCSPALSVHVVFIYMLNMSTAPKFNKSNCNKCHGIHVTKRTMRLSK